MSNCYPYLAYTHKYQGKEVCCICGKTASHKFEVQWSWMRGDDEYYPTCPYHLTLGKANLNKFMKLIPTTKGDGK